MGCFIKFYPTSKARILLSKILPQTSRNFTQIYLPYLRHYQTLQRWRWDHEIEVVNCQFYQAIVNLYHWNHHGYNNEDENEVVNCQFYRQWSLNSSWLGKPSSNSCWGHLGIARKGGGVSTLARMVWGTFLEKNLPRSNGHLLGFGGV